MEPQAFLDRHIPTLLRILQSPHLGKKHLPDLQPFLDRVDEDFSVVTSRPPSRDYLPGEDVFWWCHDSLYQLTDMVQANWVGDRYFDQLLADMRAMIPRLERREALPPTHQIGWLDDTEFDEELDIDLAQWDEPDPKDDLLEVRARRIDTIDSQQNH